MIKGLVFLALLVHSVTVIGQTKQIDEFYLYSGKIPNSKPVSFEEVRTPNDLVDSLANKVTKPTLSVFLPSKSNDKKIVVIVCPGGGYGTLLTKREGTDVARALNKAGYTAVVLKYRLPNSESMVTQSIGPLQDVQKAIHTLRKNREKWGLERYKIGVMGFSAGGHLASTAGTHFETKLVESKDTISVRPDFMVLINPVISFKKEFGHQGSAINLLGKELAPELVERFSNETRITSKTPPTFLVHNATDEVVPVENSLEFYKELRKNKVSAALHIYPKGEHGFLTFPSFNEWFGRTLQWLDSL